MKTLLKIRTCSASLYGIGFSVVALLLATGACKKDPLKHNRYSEWTINERQFRTNDVEVVEAKATSRLASRDINQRFTLEFNYSELRTSAHWPLTYNTCWGCFGGVSFYLDTSFYIISPHTTNELVASGEDGKASYYMPPTWFRSYYREGDSVLIEGTFNEP